MPHITDEKKGSESSLGILGALLSSPDVLAKMGDVISRYTSAEGSEYRDDDAHSPHIPEYIGNNSADSEGNSPTFAAPHSTPSADLSAILPSLVQALGKGGSKEHDGKSSNKEQTALLLAIRPYLSESRRELIDTFLKMNKLGELIKNLA